MFNYSLTPGQEIKTRYPAEEFKPLISIVTAVYNRVTYMEPAVRSVLNQTFPWFEWIIVDDGSTDPEVAAYLDKLPERDSRIRVVHQENGGVARARNHAARIAKSEILLIFDDDDLIEATWLDEVYWMLSKNPDASWAYHDYISFCETQGVNRWPFTSALERKWNVMLCPCAYRRAAWLSVGGQIEEPRNVQEDYHFVLSLLRDGHFPAHGHNMLYWYRVRSGTRDRQQHAMEPIYDMMKQVEEGIVAVEYPLAAAATAPEAKKSDFSFHVANPEKKRRLLFILRNGCADGDDQPFLKFLRKLDKSRYDVSVVTTEFADDSYLQEYRQEAADVFLLPSFARLEEYPEFISYLIESRGIEAILMGETPFRPLLSEWLHAMAPQVSLIAAGRSGCTAPETPVGLDGSINIANDADLSTILDAAAESAARRTTQQHTGQNDAVRQAALYEQWRAEFFVQGYQLLRKDLEELCKRLLIVGDWTREQQQTIEYYQKRDEKLTAQLAEVEKSSAETNAWNVAHAAKQEQTIADQLAQIAELQAWSTAQEQTIADLLAQIAELQAWSTAQEQAKLDLMTQFSEQSKASQEAIAWHSAHGERQEKTIAELLAQIAELQEWSASQEKTKAELLARIAELEGASESPANEQ